VHDQVTPLRAPVKIVFAPLGEQKARTGRCNAEQPGLVQCLRPALSATEQVRPAGFKGFKSPLGHADTRPLTWENPSKGLAFPLQGLTRA
jgi:hypothetical protein